MPRLKEALEKFKKHPMPLVLHGIIQHYQWGERGPEAFIPSLLGIRSQQNKPYAELWLGAHPSHPAKVPALSIPLNELIRFMPEMILGKQAAVRFKNQLPFLMKVLTASQPLSIQTHPNEKQARQGFMSEQKQGIPVTSAHRIYKDPNQKAELIIAVTDFYALCGFCSSKEYSKYKKILTLSQEQVNTLVSSLIRRIKAGKKEWKPHQIEYWILKADQEFCAAHKKDRGILCMPLLNLIHLKPGEALFLKPGDLHSYLNGVGIEVMSNSDNTLRGGLTSKYVDTAELLKILDKNSGLPGIIHRNIQGVYPTPAKEFQIQCLNLSKNQLPITCRLKSVEFLLVLKGKTRIKTKLDQIVIKKGESILVPAILGQYTITPESDTVIYKCGTP